MDKGIYTALSGGIAKSHELELIANNLANANTPGFKRDGGTFNEYLTELRRQDSVEGLKREINVAAGFDGRPQGDKSFVEMDSVYTNFAQAGLDKTNRPLDVALEGKGFFEILTPSGIRFTRQGNFSVDAQGRLVTVNGFPVLSAPTPATADSRRQEITPEGKVLGTVIQPNPDKDARPQDRVIQVGGNGPVQITENGDIMQGGQRVATLSVQEFHESQWLEKAGNSYFKNIRPENVAETNTTKAHQGFLEGSNVNPVAEMTKLIEVTRSYESHMQAIKTYQEIDGRSVNDIAGGR